VPNRFVSAKNWTCVTLPSVSDAAASTGKVAGALKVIANADCLVTGGDEFFCCGANRFLVNVCQRHRGSRSREGSGGDNERLTKRMRVPYGARAWLERDARARGACRSICLKQRINPHRASEPIGRSFRGCLGADSFDFHICAIISIRKRAGS